jgi:hypothetical protein
MKGKQPEFCFKELLPILDIVEGVWFAAVQRSIFSDNTRWDRGNFLLYIYEGPISEG